MLCTAADSDAGDTWTLPAGAFPLDAPGAFVIDYVAAAVGQADHATPGVWHSLERVDPSDEHGEHDRCPGHAREKDSQATQYQARAGRSLADGPEAVFVSDPLSGGPSEVAMIGPLCLVPKIPLARLRVWLQPAGSLGLRFLTR